MSLAKQIKSVKGQSDGTIKSRPKTRESYRTSTKLTLRLKGQSPKEILSGPHKFPTTMLFSVIYFHVLDSSTGKFCNCSAY